MKENLLTAIMVAIASYMELERASQPFVGLQSPPVQSNASRQRQLQELAWQQSMPPRLRRRIPDRNQ